MSNTPDEGRRNFLWQALLLSGGGLIVGGAAAVAGNRWWAAPVLAAPPPTVGGLASPSAASAAQLAQLQQALKSSQEALALMQTQYQTVLTRNSELQNALADKKTEADKLKMQLAEAQAQWDKYKKLLGLFDKLDTVKFDKLIMDGLTAASAGFLTVLTLTPILNAGLTVARALFDNFEKQLALFRASVDWLRAQVEGLNGNIGVVEAAMGQALKSLDPVTSRMTQLVDYILANLPFGIGQSLRITLKAVHDLYLSLPPLATGAATQVVSVLLDPFSAGEKGLALTLVKPIRDKVFEPSEKLAAQFKTLNEIYLRDLHLPARQAVDERAQVLKEIDEYRKAQNL